MSTVFSLCVVSIKWNSALHSHTSGSSQDSDHSHPKLVSTVTSPGGKVKLQAECKGFLIWLATCLRAAECLLTGHK